MSAIEIAAARQIPADGGVLSPLRLADRRNPVSCALTDALLTVQLARQATAHEAEAHWVGQVNRELARVAAQHGGGFAQDEIAPCGASRSMADMSAAELTMARLAS